MDWAQFWTELNNDAPYLWVGAGLFAVALFLRWKEPDWVGLRSYVTLTAGGFMLPLIWMVLAGLIANPKHTALLQKLADWGAEGSASWTNFFGQAWHLICKGIAADALAWILALLFAAWIIYDLFPRVWKLRGGGSAVSVGRTVSNQGGRLAALTGAEPHTMWVALLAPAILLLIPPLAAAMHMPVGG